MPVPINAKGAPMTRSTSQIMSKKIASWPREVTRFKPTSNPVGSPVWAPATPKYGGQSTLCVTRCRRERVTKPVPSDPTQFLIAKTEFPPSQFVFPRQGAAEQRGIVGIQHDRHACVEQPPDRMLLERSNRARPHVAGDANLQRDLAFA